MKHTDEMWAQICSGPMLGEDTLPPLCPACLDRHKRLLGAAKRVVKEHRDREPACQVAAFDLGEILKEFDE